MNKWCLKFRSCFAALLLVVAAGVCANTPDALQPKLIIPSFSAQLSSDPEVLTSLAAARKQVIDSIEIDSNVYVLTPITDLDVRDARSGAFAKSHDLKIDTRISVLTLLSKVDPRLYVPDQLVTDSWSDLLILDPRITALTALDKVDILLLSKGNDSQVAVVDKGTFGDIYLKDFNRSLRTRVSYDDNFYSSSTDPFATWVVRNTAKIGATFQRKESAYLVAYTFNDNRVLSSSEDNAVDHLFSFQLNERLSLNQSVELSASLALANEPRGSGLSEGANADLVSEPLGVERINAGLTHRLGNDKSKLRLANSIRYSETTYDDLPELTGAREFSSLQFDNDSKYRIGARTNATWRLGLQQIDYTLDPESVDGVRDTQDSNSQFALAGFEREFGKKSSGRFGYGLYRRDFDDSDRIDATSDFWDVSFSWQPRTYSLFNIALERSFSESSGVGEFIDSRTRTLKWAHSWADRLRTEVKFTHGEDQYVGDQRIDKRVGADLSLFYIYGDNLTIVMGSRFQDRSSTDPDIEYDRSSYFIESKLKL